MHGDTCVMACMQNDMHVANKGTAAHMEQLHACFEESGHVHAMQDHIACMHNGMPVAGKRISACINGCMHAMQGSDHLQACL